MSRPSQSTQKPFHLTLPPDWPPLTDLAMYSSLKPFAASVALSLTTLKKLTAPGGDLHECTVAHPEGGVFIRRDLAIDALNRRYSTHPDSLAMRGLLPSNRPSTLSLPGNSTADDDDGDGTAAADPSLNDHALLLRAKVEKEQYSAKLVRLEYEKAQGVTIPLETAKLLVFNAAREARNILTALPDRLAAAFAVESDSHVIHETLRNEIDAALEELASSIAKLNALRHASS